MPEVQCHTQSMVLFITLDNRGFEADASFDKLGNRGWLPLSDVGRVLFNPAEQRGIERDCYLHALREAIPEPRIGKSFENIGINVHGSWMMESTHEVLPCSM